MRALYQRRKGRDLFDLWLGLTAGGANPESVVSVFLQYMDAEKAKVSRQRFIDNLTPKLSHPGFLSDIEPLLVEGTELDMSDGHAVVKDLLLARLP